MLAKSAIFVDALRVLCLFFVPVNAQKCHIKFLTSSKG